MRSLVQLLMMATILLAACGPDRQKPVVVEEVKLSSSQSLAAPERLSEWGLFQEPMANLTPASDLLSYDLNTPLFSDYSHKLRFVKLPEGTSATYHPTEVMNFPLGAILIKNFYYPADFQKPEGDRRLLETRLLISKEEEWEALTYVWNEEQTEAFLEIAGRSIPVTWKDEKGVLQNVNYSVPNLVQCKSCHEKSGKLVPIGPTARQLNRSMVYKDGPANQLEKWKTTGLLAQLPPAKEWPVLPVWNDPTTADLASRARAWLEINCAHCHRAEGPAKNTGLYLTYEETDQYKLGVNKPPVAAGRGSGGLKYSIVPGRPEESILVHRIESLDPGVMMPEVGRKLRHEEGIELVRAWVAEMK